MKISNLLPLALLSASLSTALSIPSGVKAVSLRDAASDVVSYLEARASIFDSSALEKRKGGGGKGGGSSSSGGSKSGGSSSSSSSGRTSSSSNSGGRTTTGSGVSPAYGGGRYYGGGASVPYTSGARSPLGVTPFLLPAAALAVFPGLWLYGAYSYPYSHPYTFQNQSLANGTSPGGVNQTKPVQCWCGRFSTCGCDDNTNTTYLQSVIGNGSYQQLNTSLVRVADVNGSSTILINGTLPNGTTAAGGTSAASVVTLGSHAGWLAMGAAVVFAVNMA